MRRTAPADRPAVESGQPGVAPARSPTRSGTAENAFNRQPGVAEWRDGARILKLSNDLLDQASGITIPSSKFVLRVILAYLIAVIPLNWLICRFVLNRREWTWVVVPLVALAFAIGVERVAARDIGYDTAADEIDLLEIHGDYTRGHLHGLVSLYSNGRSRFTHLLSQRSDGARLAVRQRPLDPGRRVSTSTWPSYPVPSLMDFTVQPRSLSMFRAEQMLSLAGPIRLEDEGGKRRLVNGGELELRDAILIDRCRRRQNFESAGWARSPRERPLRSTGRQARNRRTGSTRAPAPTQPASCRVANELGTPRGKPGRTSTGGLGGGNDTWASHRTGRRSPSRLHGGRSCICAVEARRVPTAGDTTGSPPASQRPRLVTFEQMQSPGPCRTRQ